MSEPDKEIEQRLNELKSAILAEYPPAITFTHAESKYKPTTEEIEEQREWNFELLRRAAKRLL